MPIAFDIPVLMTGSPSEPSQVARVVSAHVGKPPLRARVTYSVTGAAVRTVTVQVVNGRGGASGVAGGGAGGQACKGMFMLALIVGTTETDGGAGAQVLGAPTAGAVVSSLVANVSGLYFTDTAGKLVLPITQGGPWASRSVRAVVLGPADGTDQAVV